MLIHGAGFAEEIIGNQDAIGIHGIRLLFLSGVHEAVVNALFVLNAAVAEISPGIPGGAHDHIPAPALGRQRLNAVGEKGHIVIHHEQVVIVRFFPQKGIHPQAHTPGIEETPIPPENADGEFLQRLGGAVGAAVIHHQEGKIDLGVAGNQAFHGVNRLFFSVETGKQCQNPCHGLPSFVVFRGSARLYTGTANRRFA